jgi:hypothetical protein
VDLFNARRLFPVACPVRPAEQKWVEQQLRWLTHEFGEDALHERIYLPTDDFFPGVYRGSAKDVRHVVEIVRTRMGVAPDSYIVELGDTDEEPQWTGYRRTSGAAGEYRRERDRGVISISMRQAQVPMALVATIAHEFGHHRLMGEARIDPGRRDGEPLTDLTSLFFGFGIFSANAAMEFAQTSRIDQSGQQLVGWRSSRLGYLTEPMYGYALAYWSILRGDRDPDWQRYVDTNPKAFLHKGLRYLGSRRSGTPSARRPSPGVDR